jgi:hypothetical protein
MALALLVGGVVACGDDSAGGSGNDDGGAMGGGDEDGGGVRVHIGQRDSGSGGGTTDGGTDAGPAGCASGFANCDGDEDTGDKGCETDLRTVIDCGSCGNACDLENASARCDQGECVVASCDGSYDNCDGLAGNGCETDVLADDDNCGECGMSCGTLATCSDGACVLKDPCPTGFDDCDNDPTNGCETPLNTLDDCGFCGQECAVENGTATCDSGTCEVACLTVCDDENTCTVGECLEYDCDAGWGNCDTAADCETPLDTLGHCGACFKTCDIPAASEQCMLNTTTNEYECQFVECAANTADCDGDLATCDPFTPQDCNGCETATNTIDNCGGCGMAADPDDSNYICAVPNATNVCSNPGSGFACSTSTCADRFYTVPELPGPCDCEDTPQVGAFGGTTGVSCATSKTVMQTSAGMQDIQGTIPNPGDSDWYYVNFGTAPSRTVGNGFRINFQNTSADYEFDVYSDCVSLTTLAGQDRAAESITDWQFYDSCTSPPGVTRPAATNVCNSSGTTSSTNSNAFPTTMYVRVKRTNGVLSCAQYTLRVQRN